MSTGSTTAASRNDTTPRPTTPPPCPLSTLLQWAEPLHKSSSNFSLLQLIPIHQSLLQALVATQSDESSSTTSSAAAAAAATDSSFGPWCTSAVEAQVCASVLAATKQPPQWRTYLLIVQYLFSRTTTTDTTSACQLWKTLWKYWESTTTNNNKLLQTTDKTQGDGQRQDMGLFVQAVVQVVLSPQQQHDNTPRVHSVAEMEQWIDKFSHDDEAAAPSDLYWNRTTLLLVEWSKTTNTANATGVANLLGSFLQQMLQSVWTSAKAARKDSAGYQVLSQTVGWKALTLLLLPALADLLQQQETTAATSLAEQQQHLAPLLWKTVWSFWIEQKVAPSEEQPLLMLVVTTVLCPIFPELANRKELPSLQNGDSKGSNLPLINQMDVWDFLKTCLRRGMDVLTTQSNPESLRGTLAAYRAISTLIRRRGLFLLHTLTANNQSLEEWGQYVACFETLEMEEDKHLVGQVWGTVGMLTAKASSRQESSCSPNNLPLLTMDWLYLLLGHALISADLPFLRKENLYRFFCGQTGFLVPGVSSVYSKSNSKTKTNVSGAPLSQLSFDFVWNVVIPAYDTLEQSVGLHVHWWVNGKTEKHDVAAAFDHFFTVYMADMVQRKRDEEWLGAWLTSGIMTQLRAKTVAFMIEMTAKILKDQGGKIDKVLIKSKDFGTIATNFASMMYASGRFVPVYRTKVLESLAAMLARANTVGKDDPRGTLALVGLFPYPQDMDETKDDEGFHWIDTDPIFVKLGEWIQGIAQKDSSWTSSIPSALASAFVDGMMTESEEAAHWSPGTRRKEEHSISRSIVILCVLTANQGPMSTASQMLWPAINKGLSLVPSVLLGASEKNSRRVERAAVLLEHGCKVQVLAGNGNGDLVVDRQTEQMMPPPPSIEKLLSHAVSFLLNKVQSLLAPSDDEKYGSRPSETRALSAKCAGYLETLRTLHQGYPSSSAVSNSANDSLQHSLKEIGGKEKISAASIQHLTLVFAALCSGADADIDVEATCRTICKLDIDGTEETKGAIEPVRSVFEYCRWGTLAKLLPRMAGSSNAAFFGDVLDCASSAVQKCPIEALMPLFESATTTGRYLISQGEDTGGLSTEAVTRLKRLIQVLTQVIEKCERGRRHLFVIDESARLLFQHTLLLDEYNRLQKDKQADTPVLHAFRKLVNLAGTRRPHILRTLLSRMIPAWMERDGIEAGRLAIPYREDIVKLLTYKEERLESSMLNRSDLDTKDEDDKARPPKSAHELSLVRGFILAFLSELPESNSVGEEIRVNLLNYIITTLLEMVKFGKTNLPMIGTPEYCRAHRGWQALCILSRFVGDDIAEEVCQGVFEAMDEQMHGQTRFFLEVFTIQCARKHPHVFGKALCKNLLRHDLHLQIVTSLMIVTGHLVIGNYKEDFLPYVKSGGETSSGVLDQVLAGSIPWLSSTQGFSRAIAQILVHALIPKAIDATKEDISDGSDWYLRSIYNFLESNNEMKRLRKKQQKFFDTIDVDVYCSMDGCLSVTVDEVGEAYPKHMIEIIKTTLAEVYKEAHGADAPSWKQVKTMIEDVEEHQNTGENMESSSINFQRKIIPLDALNIALDEHREKRFRNAAGRKKQPLIVCASLVDKVPNLGGLARTSEIFAADRLVIPDKKVVKMDNFTSISVSAGDWIEIEECGEKDLLRWLRARKVEGWFVLGIEQTSSSISMTDFQFPNRPTILLLGKEKEGIPVQYLQAVDQCVEFPQLGIIRSLNVHVTGALAIWEYTRQRMLESHSE